MHYEISFLIVGFFFFSQDFWWFTGCSGKSLILCLLNDNDTNLQPKEAYGYLFAGWGWLVLNSFVSGSLKLKLFVQRPC